MAFNQNSTDGLYTEESHLEAEMNGYAMEAALVAPGMPGFVPSRFGSPYASASFEMMRQKHDMDLRRIAECTHRNMMVRSVMDQRRQMAAMYPQIMPPVHGAVIPPISMSVAAQDFAGTTAFAGSFPDHLTPRPAALNTHAAAVPDVATSTAMRTSKAKQSREAKNKKSSTGNTEGKGDNKPKTDMETYTTNFPRNAREAELAKSEMVAICKANRLVDELEQQAQEKKLSVRDTSSKLSTVANIKKNTKLYPHAPGVSVLEPRHCDVLLGRGTSIDKHPGNKYFRRLLAENRADYISAPKKMRKFLIAISIVQQIHSLGGQFLQQDPDSGLWHPVDDEVAREKASRGLRRDSRRPDARITKAA